MTTFVTLTRDVTIPVAAPQVWTLALEPLEELTANRPPAVAAVPAESPASRPPPTTPTPHRVRQRSTPAPRPAATSHARGQHHTSPAPAADQPPADANDGLVINGSVNNAAASPIAQVAGFRQQPEAGTVPLQWRSRVRLRQLRARFAAVRLRRRGAGEAELSERQSDRESGRSDQAVADASQGSDVLHLVPARGRQQRVDAIGRDAHDGGAHGRFFRVAERGRAARAHHRSDDGPAVSGQHDSRFPDQPAGAGTPGLLPGPTITGDNGVNFQAPTLTTTNQTLPDHAADAGDSAPMACSTPRSHISSRRPARPRSLGSTTPAACRALTPS